MTLPGKAIPAMLMNSHFCLAKTVVWIGLFLCLALNQNALAQKAKLPVRMKLDPLTIRGRSGGPIPIQIKLEYNRNQIIEGDLILRIHNSIVSNEDMVASIRYEGVVLQGADYFFNTVLPPIEHSYTKLYQITAWFETATERIPLTSDPDQIDPPAPHDLLSIAAFERATLICSSSGRRDYLKQSGNRAFLSRTLSLANYNPPQDPTVAASGQQNRRSPINGIQDYAVNWDAFQLPEDPLHYCSFDMVLLADGATSRLEESQMQALLTWVKAGGSLCVLPDDIRLTRTHLQFLQTLFERDDDPGFHLSITDENSLLVLSDKPNVIINRHFGVGRVTLLPNLENLSQRMTDQQVRQVTGHLWKVRSDSPILQGKNWKPNQNIRAQLQQNGYRVTGQPGEYTVAGGYGRSTRLEVPNLQSAADALGLNFKLQPESNPFSGACETALLPKGISMVPTWVIAVLLIAYVVTIGPLDYLVLGFFRARKYTWILFPIVTAAFTWLTIMIADRYMSSSDSGGAISVIDVGKSGVPLRESKMQMHFYASATKVADDASQTFVVPAAMMMAGYNQYGGGSPRPITSTMSYSGRFPQSYTTEQSMRQWEPQTVRTLAFAPEDASIPKIDWDDVDLITTASGRSQLASMVRKNREPGSQLDAIVLNGSSKFPLYRSGFMFSSQQLQSGREWRQLDPWRRMGQEPNHDAIAGLGLIDAAGLDNQNNFFGIVSQVSPHGSASLEDLPVLDTSDSSQWLLMIAMKKQTTIQIYRKIYRTSSLRLIAVD